MSQGVFCYRNLHFPGVVWSVRSNKTGRVVARKTEIVLRDVTLKVSKAGNKRVREEKRKNVHAGVSGTWMRGSKLDLSKFISISYNPYKNDTFIRKDTGQPISTAQIVILKEDGAWAYMPE